MRDPELHLIGDIVDKLSVRLPHILSCLDPRESFVETEQEAKDRIKAYTYAHFIRCLSRNLSACALNRKVLNAVEVDDVGSSLVSESFCKLVNRYGFHGLLNDFHFGRVSNDLLQDMVGEFRINEKWAVGVGIFLSQSGESANSQVKSQTKH